VKLSYGGSIIGSVVAALRRISFTIRSAANITIEMNALVK
jgi:hypothetical protein